MAEICSCLLNTKAKINGEINNVRKAATQTHLAQPDQTTSILLKHKNNTPRLNM